MATWSGSAAGCVLRALLAAVARSPILARPVLTMRPAPLANWAAVRKSGNADAFVLAWIASHVRNPGRPGRVLN